MPREWLLGTVAGAAGWCFFFIMWALYVAARDPTMRDTTSLRGLIGFACTNLGQAITFGAIWLRQHRWDIGIPGATPALDSARDVGLAILLAGLAIKLWAYTVDRCGNWAWSALLIGCAAFVVGIWGLGQAGLLH